MDAAMPDQQISPRVNPAPPLVQLAPLYSFLAYHLFLLAILLFGSFDVYDLMLVFYIELIVIGVVALLRLAAGVLLGNPFRSKYIETSFGARILLGGLLAGFFIGKYGLLMLGLGLVVILLPAEIGMSAAAQTDIHPVVGWCFWLLVIRYVFVVFQATVLRFDYRDESVVELLLYPYMRGIWLGASIAAGFVVAALYGEADAQLYFTAGVLCARLIPDLIVLLLELRTARQKPLIRCPVPASSR
jgi:hypothetical protein